MKRPTLDIMRVDDLEHIHMLNKHIDYLEAEKKEKIFEIEFGKHLATKIKVTDSGIEIIGAIDGWGNGVPNSEIKVKQQNQDT
jgi:hypothetical protein